MPPCGLKCLGIRRLVHLHRAQRVQFGKFVAGVWAHLIEIHKKIGVGHCATGEALPQRVPLDHLDARHRVEAIQSLLRDVQLRTWVVTVQARERIEMVQAASCFGP